MFSLSHVLFIYEHTLTKQNNLLPEAFVNCAGIMKLICYYENLLNIVYTPFDQCFVTYHPGAARTLSVLRNTLMIA